MGDAPPSGGVFVYAVRMTTIRTGLPAATWQKLYATATVQPTRLARRGDFTPTPPPPAPKADDPYRARGAQDDEAARRQADTVTRNLLLFAACL